MRKLVGPGVVPQRSDFKNAFVLLHGGGIVEIDETAVYATLVIGRNQHVNAFLYLHETGRTILRGQNGTMLTMILSSITLPFYTDDLRNDSSDRPEFYLWPLFLPAALSIDKAARAAGRPQRIPTCRRKLSAAQSRDELELLYIIVGK